MPIITIPCYFNSNYLIGIYYWASIGGYIGPLAPAVFKSQGGARAHALCQVGSKVGMPGPPGPGNGGKH